MSRRPGYYQERYAANRERERARQKAWRDANIERCREREAAWRKAHPEAVAAKLRRYRQKPEVKRKDAAAHRARRAAHGETVRALDRLHYARAVLRKRAQRRVSHAKAMIRAGKMYRPLYRMRLPAWVAACEMAVDARSPWLAENLTPAQRAYARDLAIERKERR